MRRLLLIIAAGTLAFAGTASAKGPSTATVTGPGLKHAAIIKGNGETGPGTPLGALTEYAGFFPAFYVQTPDPMLDSRPAGPLGPKYTVTYRVQAQTGVNTVHQDLYPYAVGGPVTYTRPGQQIFDLQSRGGWYKAPAGLKSTLVTAGLPASAPSGPGGDSTFAFSPGELTMVAIAGALLLAAAAAAVAQRRLRPAGAR